MLSMVQIAPFYHSDCHFSNAPMHKTQSGAILLDVCNRKFETKKVRLSKHSNQFVLLKLPTWVIPLEIDLDTLFCAQKMPLISATFRTGSRFGPNRVLSGVLHNQIARICVTDATLYVLISRDTNIKLLPKISKVFSEESTRVLPLVLGAPHLREALEGRQPTIDGIVTLRVSIRRSVAGPVSRETNPHHWAIPSSAPTTECGNCIGARDCHCPST